MHYLFRTMVRIGLFFSGLMGLCSLSIAQTQTYPKGYYQFPIRPGLANSLAGGLGDLRTNHFHAGLDIRTEQREGLNVYAAAEGYVYKVAVQRSGYGNVIYLRHPNGQTTVYGHLLKFSDPLATYVREEQYKKQTFEIDLFPEAGKFNFRKGEIIALSGNTGGSAGPHLHFEIRDSKDNYLNPLYFGFNEIKDVTPPKFVNLAIRPLDINGRVNSQFDRKVYAPVKLKDGSYRLPDTVSATGIIGIDMVAHDQMTGTGFRYGLQCIEIKMDGDEVFSYNIEIFPNSATRDYNNLIDYETEQKTGQRYLKCYVPDGNNFNLYKTNAINGKLNIADTLLHEVRIKITDSYENASELVFTIKGEPKNPPLPVYDVEINPEYIQTDVQENTLIVKAKHYRSTIPFATYYSNGKEVKKDPDFYASETAVFLTDLRTYTPDSVQIGKTTVKTYLRSQIYPAVASSYKAEKWSVDFKNTSIFDTLFLTGQQNFNALTINNRGTALKDYISVAFSPENVPENKEKTRVYRYLDGYYRFLGGTWVDNEIKFETRELGTFVIQADTVPPKIRLVEHSKDRIRGFIGDATSGVDHYKALVNGEWVLMNFDSKKGYIWSEKLDPELPFEGELTLEVTDRAGNSTILQTELKDLPVVRKKTKKRKR
ncbi:M23 family metallopeptidase [Dyadobacter fanqingshengii]|uniref:M23 family metallopeptidase n=1 Tax=Dyadobacter fanqingshengii TaxID=2906443 RepID=A0A9X1PEL7_9BACT|nr:M23 family metallopeptidase [Dyadobacter fanqingshengii]MCF0043157.1 M23 family metallopeptidase [Dyadobacter fanqingshengii]MCF0043235.1 M23 family metallopeptidase [Dyadobacter fanqingshengii]USJ35710.1 M23 family metallopeptidase [Dyadobacter fanqingshengii]